MLGTSWECHKVREIALRPMGDFLLVLDLLVRPKCCGKPFDQLVPTFLGSSDVKPKGRFHHSSFIFMSIVIVQYRHGRIIEAPQS